MEYKSKDEIIDELYHNVKQLHEENQHMQMEIELLKQKMEDISQDIDNIYDGK
jgi:prefoldin subunit 5